MKKRIALAVVAALAGGLLVAAPASASAASNAGTPFFVGNIANTSSPSSATAAATETATVVASTASVVNYVTVNTVGGDTVTVGGYLSVTGSTFETTTDGTLSSDATKISFSSAAIDTSSAKVVIPAAAGTVVVKYTTAVDNGSSITYAVAQTITISVTAAPTPATYNHTEVGALGAFSDGANAYTDANGGAFVPAKIATAGVPETVTAFSIKQYASVDTSTLAGTLSKAVTVSLSGVGVISDGTNNNVTYLAYSAGSSDTRNIVVSRDGRSGVATITIAVDGAVLATRVVTFYGAIASFGLSISNAQLQAGDTFTLTLTKKDANGIAVPTAANWSLETGTLGAPTQYVPGTETVTAVYAGKAAAKVVAGNNLVDTKTVVANWVTAGVKTVVLTADKASYAPGEKATFTVTAKNSDGVTAGDATYALTVGGSAALYTLAGSVAVKNGVGTFTAYMPVVQGPVVVTASLAGSTAGTVSVAVVDVAAVAQAAAITALQTSVATLTTTVASLVASMTAQIKVINATMRKIQKAITALRKQIKK